MGRNPKCLRRVLLPLPSPVLANIHSILAYDVSDTDDVGLPIKFRFNVGPALQPIASSMPVNRLRRWPNTNLSPGLWYTLRKHVTSNQYCFNVDHSLRHWPVIETGFDDCTVFSDCCIMPSSSIQLSATGRLLDITYMCYVFRTPLFPAQLLLARQFDLSVTSIPQSVSRWRHNEYPWCSHPLHFVQALHTPVVKVRLVVWRSDQTGQGALCRWPFKSPAPDNTIYWPDADVMLGHRLRRWASIIPTKTLQALNHKYNRKYYYFWTPVKDKST